MSVYVESGIEFDFSSARTVIEHDKSAPTHAGGTVHKNSVWPGVDFCIEETLVGQTPAEWIWLEVKSWEPSRIDPHRRGGNRWSFICKMKSDRFAMEMRDKFLGTTAFLAWTNNFTLAQTRFVLLFEPPTPMDSALLGSRNTRMQGRMSSKLWVYPIRVSVLTLKGWNARFGVDYPAHIQRETI